MTDDTPVSKIWREWITWIRNWYLTITLSALVLTVLVYIGTIPWSVAVLGIAVTVAFTFIFPDYEEVQDSA